MRAAWAGLGVLLLAHGLAAEVCFRTPAEAGAQAGVKDAAGFRLELTRRDAFARTTWARVQSCARPQEPARWVVAGGLTARPGPALESDGRARVSIQAAVMRAGTRVTLLMRDEQVSVEAAAMVLENGVVGDRVRVRIVGVSAEAGERIVEGVVRDQWVVEAVR